MEFGPQGRWMVARAPSRRGGPRCRVRGAVCAASGAAPSAVAPFSRGALAGSCLGVGGRPVSGRGHGPSGRGLFRACGAYLRRGVGAFPASSRGGSGRDRKRGCPPLAAAGGFGLFLGWRPAQRDTLGPQPLHPCVEEPGRDGVGARRLLVAAAAGRAPNLFRTASGLLKERPLAGKEDLGFCFRAHAGGGRQLHAVAKGNG